MCVGWYSKKEIWGTSDLTYDILSKYPWLLYLVHWNYYFLEKPKKTHALMHFTFTADDLSYALSNFFYEKYPFENTLRIKDTFDK